MAARAVRGNERHLSSKAIARRLQWRGKGWSTVTEADVRKALTRARSADKDHLSPPPAGKRSGKQNGRTRRDRSSNSPARSVPSPDTIAAIARDLRGAQPGLGAYEIARYMRLRGWSAVTSADVRNALALVTAGPDSGRRPAPPTTVSGAGKQHSKTDAGDPSPGLSIYEPSMQDIAKAVREIRAADPDVTDSALAQQLRQRGGVGWSAITRDDVRRALEGAAPEPRRDKPPARALAINRTGKKPGRARTRTPSTDRPVVTRPVDAQPVSRSDLCPACGVAVSVLGTCRCS